MSNSNFLVNVPLNNLSFGFVAFGLLRECHRRGLSPCIMPIGGNVDLSAQEINQDFGSWLNNNINKTIFKHNRKNLALRLWHINGSLESLSKSQHLLTFFELDSLTSPEINILKNQDTVFVTSKYTQQIFEEVGVSSTYVPLGFDKDNFYPTDKKYFDDDSIVFFLGGKWEFRKHTERTIRAWVKAFGNNKKYRLHCSVYNPFFHQNPEECLKINKQLFHHALDNKNIWNVEWIPPVKTNAEYNDIINSANIVISFSGGEGRNLPLMHGIGLGKHAALLYAHSHKDFASEDNAVLVKPNGKVKAADGVFFHENGPFNSGGNFFTYSDDDAIAAMEEAVKRYESNPINTAGLKLQEITYKETVDSIFNKMFA